MLRCDAEHVNPPAAAILHGVYRRIVALVEERPCAANRPRDLKCVPPSSASPSGRSLWVPGSDPPPKPTHSVAWEFPATEVAGPITPAIANRHHAPPSRLDRPVSDGCGAKFRVPNSKAGQTLSCQWCSHKQLAPPPPPPPAEIPPPPPLPAQRLPPLPASSLFPPDSHPREGVWQVHGRVRPGKWCLGSVWVAASLPGGSESVSRPCMRSPE